MLKHIFHRLTLIDGPVTYHTLLTTKKSITFQYFKKLTITVNHYAANQTTDELSATDVH